MKDIVLAKFINFSKVVIERAQSDYLNEIDQIRKHEVLMESIPDVVIEEETMMRGESLDDLTENESMLFAFQTLTENEAVILFRLMCLEQSMEHIAVEMKIHYNSVSRIKVRALRKLRKGLARGSANV